jgi:hypothetical protein
MSGIPIMTAQELYSAFGGQMVFVYFNLHSKKWSVRLKSTGRVVAHCSSLSLSHASPVVSEAGRQRVIREKRKNVHAGIVGIVARLRSTAIIEWYMRPMRQISYNPYKWNYFFHTDDCTKFDCADYVEFHDKSVWATKWAPTTRVTVKVGFQDGNSLVSTINGDYDNAVSYYLGKTFNVGGGCNDNMVKAVSVELVA